MRLSHMDRGFDPVDPARMTAYRVIGGDRALSSFLASESAPESLTGVIRPSPRCVTEAPPAVHVHLRVRTSMHSHVKQSYDPDS